MNLTLEGKVALVTGAARGIGLAISQQLASQGAHVVLVDVAEDVVASAAKIGPSASSHIADVTDEAIVSNLINNVAAQYGQLDILVNNAGISPKKNGRKFYLEETPAADWHRVMAVNLTSIFLLSKACAPLMKARGKGRIINISSQAGRGRSDLTSAHYATSKAGVIGLTRSMAGELGKHGITVTAVAPGFIETEMSNAYSGERREAVIASIPVKHAGTVLDIASAVGFLASDASGFINGAVLDVNGGGYM